jgi:ATP-dependent Clp protease protease subunit
LTPVSLDTRACLFQVTYYAQLSGQSREKVALDLDRDNFLSAQEALAYGLVDRIVE